MIELFMGSNWRRKPGSPHVYPSVARTTHGARTRPCDVRTSPADRLTAGVCS